MLVEVHCDGVTIGSAELSDLDPPIGVAMGRLVPTASYCKSMHANVIDEDFVGDRNEGFVLQSSEHGSIKFGGCSIHDYSTELGEIWIHVIYIPYPEYETYFGATAQFRAYWSK